jgi:hypothetical protein
MAQKIQELLLRNLHEVFGENNADRRRAVISEIFQPDAVFYEPNNVYVGHEEIARIAGELRAQHPDFQYQPLSEPEISGNAGRVQWVSGRLGEKPAYAGTDFLIAKEGKIAALYLFFDRC